MRKAGLLSVAFREGDRDAAWRLKQRGRALKGIKRAGPEAIAERLRRANEARRKKCERRLRHERMERLCRPWQESTRDL